MMKKQFMKRGLVFLLALAMLGSVLTACTGQNGGDAAGSAPASTTAPASGSTTEQAAGVPLDPVEFTLYVNYDWFDASPQWGADEVSKELQKKFNITVKYAKPDGDPLQKLNLMIASDDIPDVVEMDRDINYTKMIGLQKFLPLDDYIAKYDGYKSVVAESTRNLAKVNGKTYGLLNWSTTPDHGTGNAAWLLDKQWYEQLGSPKLETMDDLYNLLKLVKEKNLKINGQSVLPIQLDGSNSPFMIYNSFGGVPIGTSGVYQDGDQLKLYFSDPKFESAMVYFNKLWREGLINKDLFIEKKEQALEKLSNRRIAVMAEPDVTQLIDVQKTLHTADPAYDLIPIEPPVAPGVAQKDVMWGSFQTLGWNALCISAKAKNAERIYQLLDYIITPEGNLLTGYGPKGTLYNEVDEKGYPVIIKNAAEMTTEETKALGTWKWVLLGNTLFSDLSSVAYEESLPAEKRGWNGAKYSWDHVWDGDVFINTIPDPTSPEGIAYSAFLDIQKKYIPKIAMAGSEEDCKKAIKQAADEAYKVGFDKVEKFMTGIWQENLKQLKGQ